MYVLLTHLICENMLVESLYFMSKYNPLFCCKRNVCLRNLARTHRIMTSSDVCVEPFIIATHGEDGITTTDQGR